MCACARVCVCVLEDKEVCVCVCARFQPVLWVMLYGLNAFNSYGRPFLTENTTDE